MANESRIANLVNADIDGSLSARQQVRLAKLRRADPDVETAYQEIATIANRLQSLQRIDPPADLKERILDALPPLHHGTRRSVVFRPTRRYTFGHPALRLATAFTGGLVVATLLFLAGTRTDATEATRAVGTIGADVANEPLEAGRSIVEINANGFIGTATLGRRGQQITLEVAGSADGNGAVSISYSDEQVAFRGYVDRSTSANATVSAEAGTVTISPEGPTAMDFNFEAVGVEATRFVVNVGDPNVAVVTHELTI